LTTDLDLRVYNDGYKKEQGPDQAEMKGEVEVAKVQEKSPKKPVAKSMMKCTESYSGILEVRYWIMQTFGINITQIQIAF
jgi:hypothetical protein